MSVSPEDRSRIMRAVKGRDTKPEMTVRRMVHAMGYRYRLHRKDLPGKPDLAFASAKKTIFVHGCFWHGHDCPRGARVPKSNRDYWTNKIADNRARDARAQKQLIAANWGVLVLWECKLKDRADVQVQIRTFLDA
jgi:DNA mismatch endonuclease (patch repair protein)